MKFTSLLLIPDDQQWQLLALQHETVADQFTVDWPKAGERDQLQHLQNIKTTLQNWGYHHHPTVIAIPDNWCVCSHLLGNRTKQSRQNVLYDFEARWPLAIEEVVADYLPGKDDTLGICATIKQLKPIIDAIAGLDLNLQAICPKALLALQQHLASNDSTPINQTVWANGKAYHWFNIADRKPTRWTWLAPDVKNLILQAKSQYIAGMTNQHVQLLDFPQTISDQIKSLSEVASTQSQSLPLTEQVYGGANRIAVHKSKPWINLLRSPLIANTQEQSLQRGLSTLLLCIVVLGLSMAGSLYWRAMQYQQIAQNNRIAQQQTFRDIFPDARRVPPNVLSRMSSELQNMLNHASVLNTDTPGQDHTSALTLLHAVLQSLPENLPLDLQEMRLEKQRIILRGQAGQHADVQHIANALRTHPKLKVDTPQMTQTQDGQIQYTVSAAWQSDQSKGDQP